MSASAWCDDELEEQDEIENDQDQNHEDEKSHARRF